MLEKLLHALETGGTLRPALLAQQLGTSVAMIETLLDDLKRRGLVREVNLNCQGSCGGCPFTESCAPHREPGRLWQVVQKG